MRELAFQRLVQRLLDLEGVPRSSCQTVATYAIIDTGLRYARQEPNANGAGSTTVEQINPATGWRGERCVLEVRNNNKALAACFTVTFFLLHFSTPHSALACLHTHTLSHIGAATPK